MSKDRITELIKRGEGAEIEFKESFFKLNKNAFESICAFLNRGGGHLLLGVSNSGIVEGIVEESIQSIIDGIVTNANNLKKLNPPFYLSPEVVEVDGKKIIYLHVPESSQVHQTAGKIFIRNEDGDFDITGRNDLITQLYARKQSTYSENTIYPYLTISDLNDSLFNRILNLAKSERPDHPWLGMNFEECLRTAGLYRKDYQTGKKGYTLAGVLLLGRDEVIRDIVPHYKTDAILRRENTDRYDDREDIRTNLVESYDQLMAFVRKHLPDRFYQEADQRISIRDRIFREVIANCLIHREFTNPFPARFVIEQDVVFTENWNRPHGGGRINPADFSPFPKNPVIARFFREIGRVDELGSGIRNTFKYCAIYQPGSEPEFLEDDVFKTIIPLPDIPAAKHMGPGDFEEGKGPENGTATLEKVRRKFGKNFGETSEKIIQLVFNEPAISARKMSEEIGISSRAVEKQLASLKQRGVLERIGPARGGYWKVNV